MKLSDCFNHECHLVLGDVATWPSDLLCVLDSNKSGLMDFHQEQTRLDVKDAAERAAGDYRNLWDPEPNKYEAVWIETLEQIKELLPQIPAVGFHCTRLAEDEITDIREAGLQPLTPALTRQRVQHRVANGDLTQATAAKLLQGSQANQSNRSARVCLVDRVSQLKSEGGFYRLFKYWGGEALYWMHEEDQKVARELQAFGEACIVVGSLNAGELGKGIDDAAERFVYVFWDQRCGIPTDSTRDLSIRRTVRTLDVIKRSDDRFELFTSASGWRERI
jgi:hypothetical protein